MIDSEFRANATAGSHWKVKSPDGVLDLETNAETTVRFKGEDSRHALEAVGHVAKLDGDELQCSPAKPDGTQSGPYDRGRFNFQILRVSSTDCARARAKKKKFSVFYVLLETA